MVVNFLGWGKKIEVLQCKKQDNGNTIQYSTLTFHQRGCYLILTDISAAAKSEIGEPCRERDPEEEYYLLPKRNIEKLQKVVNDGNYYGAQQMYKSVTARYILAERYSEALDILQSGACIQLEHGQVTCGAELAVLFVETLVKGKFPYNENTLDRVRKIYEKFPRIPLPQHLELGDDDDSMEKFSEAFGAAKTRKLELNDARMPLLASNVCTSRETMISSKVVPGIKGWSAECGACRNGSPELYDMLAEYIFSESPEVDMTRVSSYFVRGKQPRKFASTLVNFMGKCYPGEDDLAIARAILLYLSLGNLRDANCLLDEVKKQVKANKQLEFPSSDLIQFISYLLQTLQRDALPLFNMLRKTYKSSIDIEPVLNELLDGIAEKFYGVRRRNPLQGIFGDFFKMR
ncbi:unnamed protein product [Camellia sinensis]